MSPRLAMKEGLTSSIYLNREGVRNKKCVFRGRRGPFLILYRPNSRLKIKREDYDMEYKFIDISEPTLIPPPRELTAEEETEMLKQYKATRTPDILDAEYQDFEKQVAEGILAEDLLRELQDDSHRELISDHDDSRERQAREIPSLAFW